MINKIKKEYQLALLEHKIKSNNYSSHTLIKNITLNCMIKDAYEWNNIDLIKLIIEYDSTTYMYLLKRLIMLKHNKQFMYYFNKYNINWNKNLHAIQWLLFPCIKAGNIKICNYLIEQFPKLDLYDNGKYIHYICKLDEIDLYPRSRVIIPFIKHMELEETLANQSIANLECIYRYNGAFTSSDRYLYCAYRKRAFDDEKKWDELFKEIVSHKHFYENETYVKMKDIAYIKTKEIARAIQM